MKSPKKNGTALTGESLAMRRLRHEVHAVAALDSSVLLTGETGTGKGRAARRIHELSARASSPFVHVDCAALAGSLIESELFGHERGAFTGAAERYVGRFERAGRGTIFLDEIGDLAPELQAKLLRVLEDREYERVGGRETLHMRARVIAASSRPLFPPGADGTFRSDLYFRLSVFQLELPPLRERRDDLHALAEQGVDRICAELGRPRPQLAPGFVERLAQHDWPGNVRELMNALERALARCRRGALSAADLAGALRPSPRLRRVGRAATARMPGGLRQDLAEIERREILDALATTGGNVAGAARRLHIPRGTLRHKLRKLALEQEDDETSGRSDR